jgi:hypothetical protein
MAIQTKDGAFAMMGQESGAPKKVCAACSQREACTKNKAERTIKRHLRQEELDRMRERSRSAQAGRGIKTRQHLMERSFASGTRYDYDRARRRDLWRVQIQEYLISAIQDTDVLVKNSCRPKRALLAVAKT